MISAEQLRAAFPFQALVILADTEYAEPELAWLQSEFWDWFKARRWKLGLDRWTRRNDCDNFARSYAQDCADCWAVTPGPPDCEGCAVGEFFYVSRNGPHAIVIACTADRGRVYIEPQTGGTLTLTPQEEQSCFFVRF